MATPTPTIEPGGAVAAPSPVVSSAARRKALRFWMSIATAGALLLLGVSYLAFAMFVRRTSLGTPEAIVFAAVVALDALVVGNVGRLKISTRGVEVQMREVRRRQNRQQADIEALKWLVSYFASDAEYEHLRSLGERRNTGYDFDDVAGADGQGAHRQAMKAFQDELRNLRSRGLIRMLDPNAQIAQMKPKGDLLHWFEVTPRGYSYLDVRRRAEDGPEPTGG